MTSLLSVFDPGSNLSFSSWLILGFVSFYPVKYFFWKKYSYGQALYHNLLKNLTIVFSSEESLVHVSLFLFFFLVNYMGLIPHSFSLSSHFSFNFCVGFLAWISTMLWGVLNHLNFNIAHLTPLGCPLILVPFMVLVETISVLIRPATLSLRLMANTMAGHMILSLISEAVCSLPYYGISFFFLEVGFFMFEMGVAVVQSYVFTMLTKLYWQESSPNH